MFKITAHILFNSRQIGIQTRNKRKRLTAIDWIFIKSHVDTSVRHGVLINGVYEGAVVPRKIVLWTESPNLNIENTFLFLVLFFQVL